MGVIMLEQIWKKRTALLAQGLNYLPTYLKQQLYRSMNVPWDYPELDPTLKCLMAYQHQQGYRGLISSNLQNSRNDFVKSMSELIYQPTPLAWVQDFSLSLNHRLLPVRHYHPSPQQACPMIVFFHGGGFVLGNLDTHDEACRILAKYSGCQVLSVDYPLAPEATAQQIIETCEMAWHWIWQHQDRFNIQPNAIAVAGDSAGANMSTVLAQRLKQHLHAPIAQLLIYPTVDFKSRYPSFFKYKAGLLLTEGDVDQVTQHYVLSSQLELDDPLVSPIYAQLDRSGPCFLVTAGHDILHDEGAHYAQLLQQANVKVCHRNYAHQLHGFINLTSVSYQSKNDWIEISQLFRKFLN